MEQSQDTFEKRLARLQEIVATLETGELALENGVALFKEGVSLAGGCRNELEKAKKEVQVYSKGIWHDVDGQEGSDALEEGK